MPFTLDAVARTGSGALSGLPAGWYAAAGTLKDVYRKVSTDGHPCAG